MEPTSFDELTKALATSTSRRKALQRIGGTLAGSLLAAWPFTQALAAGGGNSDCAHFCAAVFGANTPAAGQCTSDAAHGMGLCHNCGGNADPSSICCTRNSRGYCSTYSPTLPCSCGANQTCQNGVCGCASGQTLCGGTCVNTQNDLNNCGSCGNVCTTSVANATAVCNSGVCGFVCNSGYKSCNGTCIPNGQCCQDTDCPQGQACVNGVCMQGYTNLCQCNDGSQHQYCTTSCDDDTPCNAVCTYFGGYDGFSICAPDNTCYN